MASWNTAPLRSHLPPPLPAPVAAPPSLVARIQSSTWLSIALRILAVTIALFVLAWIGKTAAAGPSASPAAGALEGDAAASAERASAADAGPAPPSSVAVPAPPLAPLAAGVRSHASTSEPVFINHAGVDELRRLPGVGPKRAEAILVLRQRLGRFQRVEDLLRVKGVGRGAVKKWRPLVRLDTPSAENPGDGGLR